MTDRKKPGVAFWATVVLVVVLVGYPLSFGPACWWFSGPRLPFQSLMTPSGIMARKAPTIYWPIGRLAAYGPRTLNLAIEWYATLGVGTDVIRCDIDANEKYWVITFMSRGSLVPAATPATPAMRPK